jgi:hypothetical protein
MLVFTIALIMLVAANVAARILRDHGTYPDLRSPLAEPDNLRDCWTWKTRLKPIWT